MFNKLSKAIHNLYHGKKGITGLETAIILIAFVTVAAVLAYTVLSAGIFSSERGKEAVYSGLNSAQSTMDVKGSVLASDVTAVTMGHVAGTDFSVQFTLAMAIGGGSVDLSKMSVKYWDSKGNIWNNLEDTSGAVGLSATTLSGSDQVLVTIYPFDGFTVAPTALAAYDTFTLQLIPPTGATITIQRTLPGDVTGDVVNLN